MGISIKDAAPMGMQLETLPKQRGLRDLGNAVIREYHEAAEQSENTSHEVARLRVQLMALEGIDGKIPIHQKNPARVKYTQAKAEVKRKYEEAFEKDSHATSQRQGAEVYGQVVLDQVVKELDALGFINAEEAFRPPKVDKAA